MEKEDQPMLIFLRQYCACQRLGLYQLSMQLGGRRLGRSYSEPN